MNAPSVRSLLDHCRVEETALAERLRSIDRERSSLEARLREVKKLRVEAEDALESGDQPALQQLVRVSERKLGPVPQEAGISRRPRRKGRRRIQANDVHDLGIVDAAIELARQRQVAEATAGDVLDWFKEVGYKSRTGIPSRNSIYVSLNREFTEGQRRGRVRITRPARGRFVFHYDA